MNLETIALIGILTLLAILLGADFSSMLIFQPAVQRLSNSACLEAIENSYSQTARPLIAVFLGGLAFAVVLNVIANSRTEPYLLRIGLISLVAYSALVAVRWNAIAWLRLPAILVAYWSFLHYALNPKVKS